MSESYVYQCAMMQRGGGAVESTIVTEIVPLRRDESGGLRVGSTRVPLDAIVISYQQGSNAEEIVQQYPTLALADVYVILGYYLHNQEEIEEYLRQRREYADALRREIEERFPTAGICERLLARRRARDEHHDLIRYR